MMRWVWRIIVELRAEWAKLTGLPAAYREVDRQGRRMGYRRMKTVIFIRHPPHRRRRTMLSIALVSVGGRITATDETAPHL
jgi:hypothetical protein